MDALPIPSPTDAEVEELVDLIIEARDRYPRDAHDMPSDLLADVLLAAGYRKIPPLAPLPVTPEPEPKAHDWSTPEWPMVARCRACGVPMLERDRNYSSMGLLERRDRRDCRA